MKTRRSVLIISVLLFVRLSLSLLLLLLLGLGGCGGGSGSAFSEVHVTSDARATGMRMELTESCLKCRTVRNKVDQPQFALNCIYSRSVGLEAARSDQANVSPVVDGEGSIRCWGGEFSPLIL